MSEAKLQRRAVAAEIVKLTWALDFEAEVARLARSHTYEELVALLAVWRSRDDEDKGEAAARRAKRGRA